MDRRIEAATGVSLLPWEEDVLPTLAEFRAWKKRCEPGKAWDGRSSIMNCRYPLHTAAHWNSVKTLQLLLSWGAVINHRSDVIVLLASVNETALHVACTAGNVDAVRILAKAGANLTMLCGNGLSPLRKAVVSGHAPTVMFLLEQRGVGTPEGCLFMICRNYYERQRGLINILFRHKANVNARDFKSNTLLHAAIQSGASPDLLSLLTKQEGIDLDARNLAGDTPLLHLWQRTQRVYRESTEEDEALASAKILIDAGASLQMVNEEHGTSLMHMAITKRRIAFLREHGMELDEPTNHHKQTPLNYLAFLDYSVANYLAVGANVHIPDDHDFVPLHWACYHHNPNSVRCLLEAGANPNQASGLHGRTALHLMAIVDRVNSYCRFSSAQCIQLLQDFGGNIDSLETSTAWTPLHHATFRGSWEVFQLLLDHGASTSKCDKRGRTLLHLVALRVKYGHNTSASRLVDILWCHELMEVDRMEVFYSKIGLSPPSQQHPSDPHPPNLYTKIDARQRLIRECGFGDVILARGDLDQIPLKMTQVLLDRGADVLATDKEGNLPFFLAAAYEQVDAVFVMLKTAAHQGLFTGTMYKEGGRT